jgi:hypothetical protein
MVCHDNATRNIPDLGNLCSAITQDEMKIRVFGRFESITVRCRRFFLSNGYNITVEGDLNRRTLICSMDRRVERPEHVRFRGNPEVTNTAYGATPSTVGLGRWLNSIDGAMYDGMKLSKGKDNHDKHSIIRVSG